LGYAAFGRSPAELTPIKEGVAQCVVNATLIWLANRR
jgi:hypothetical protein